MKVVAIRTGHYGTIRKPGVTFEITDPEHYSERWMKPVDSKEAKAFLKDLEVRSGKQKRDAITGEQIDAGNVLAATMDELAELRAELAALKAASSVQAEEVQPQTPADEGDGDGDVPPHTETAEPVDQSGDDRPAGAARRRTRK